MRKKIRAIKFLHMHPDQYTIKPPKNGHEVGTKWHAISRDTEAAAINLIQETLVNLKDANVSPSLEVGRVPETFSSTCPEEKYYGWKRLQGELEDVAGRDDLHFEQIGYKASNDVEVNWLLGSIVDAKFPVQCLNLCLEAPLSFKKASPALGPESSMALGMCLSSLTSLSLTLDRGAAWKLVGVYTTLHKALGRSTGLKKVSLGLTSGSRGREKIMNYLDDARLFRDILMRSPNLESLTLHHCQLCQHNLHVFLKASVKTLKELEFVEVAIEPEAKWKDTFLCIAKYCERLELFAGSSLYQGTDELEFGQTMPGGPNAAQAIAALATESMSTRVISPSR